MEKIASKEATLDVIKANEVEGTLTPVYEVFLDVPKSSLRRTELGNLFSFNIEEAKLLEVGMAASSITTVETDDKRAVLSMMVNDGYLNIFLNELKLTDDIYVLPEYERPQTTHAEE